MKDIYILCIECNKNTWHNLYKHTYITKDKNKNTIWACNECAQLRVMDKSVQFLNELSGV